MVLVDSCAWIESLRRNGDLRVKLAIDAHFQEIAKHAGLLLYRPGYGGSFNDQGGG